MTNRQSRRSGRIARQKPLLTHETKIGTSTTDRSSSTKELGTTGWANSGADNFQKIAPRPKSAQSWSWNETYTFVGVVIALGGLLWAASAAYTKLDTKVERAEQDIDSLQDKTEAITKNMIENNVNIENIAKDVYEIKVETRKIEQSVSNKK